MKTKVKVIDNKMILIPKDAFEFTEEQKKKLDLMEHQHIQYRRAFGLDLMDRQYVTMETAKILKEYGFNEKTGAYWQDGVTPLLHTKSTINNNQFENNYEAPTQEQARKWIRENKGVHIGIDCNHSGWYFTFCKTNGTTLYDYNINQEHPNRNEETGYYDSYEEALEVGIRLSVIYQQD